MWAPIPTFFKPGPEQEVDIAPLEQHIINLAHAGVYPVILGSMGEAFHLTFAERNEIVAAARKALDSDPALSAVPLIAGCGANTTRETIALCKEAAKGGADYVMVITPSYFIGALDRESVRDFFVEVAEASPIPLILYNYPGASAGLDLDSDLIAEIASLAPNVCGIKLTCGAVGKLTRITSLRPDFAVLGGFADIILPGMAMGGKGAIIGLGNVIPYTCARLYELVKSGKAGSEEAIKLQQHVSQADWVFAKAGIAGTKRMLETVYGYGGVPRKPLRPMKEDQWLKLKEVTAQFMQYESKLASAASKRSGAQANGVH